MNTKKTALVVGAQGIIGRTLADHLLIAGDWNVIGLSRRAAAEYNGMQNISVDLLDREATRAKLAALKSVTHIFYAAYQDRPSWSELVQPNLAMLVNVVDAINEVANDLQHVSLMQGYKVYGAHLGPFKSPAREHEAGLHMPPEFNVDQQRYLMQKQQGKKWNWSAIRPSVVGGFALGNPMNLAMVIAVYSTISKELSIPLRFPGKPGSYDKLLEMTDAGLLARATIWAATDERCANQAFNINNGDYFRWSEMWPKMADYFGIDMAPQLPLSLRTVMGDKEPVWNRLKEKHGLTASYGEVSSWAFGDAVFSWDYDMLADGSKARRFGFHEYINTEEMFYSIFDDMKRRRIIPAHQRNVINAKFEYGKNAQLSNKSYLDR